MIREIYGKKIGMTQLFDTEGNLSAVTLLEVEPVYFLEKVDYPTKSRVRIGCFKLGEKKTAKLKQPQAGYFKKLGVEAYKLVREVEPAPKAEVKSDSKPVIGVEMFKEGDLVNVRAKTKGKGFAGGMKRHGWRGQPKSHGSTSHRRVGSIGASAYPSRVIKGINMPGHMGNKFRTTKNLKVIKVDKEKSIIFLSGCIPGARGAVVRLKKIS